MLEPVMALGVGGKALLGILGIVIIAALGTVIVMAIFPKVFEKGKLGWLKLIIMLAYMGITFPLFYFVYVPFLKGL